MIHFFEEESEIKHVQPEFALSEKRAKLPRCVLQRKRIEEAG
jgi:hypothetical protein